MKATVDRDRLVADFLALVSISSPSKREAGVAKWLMPVLEGLGAVVEVDGAGARIGGDTGNLLARLPGTLPDAPPFLLSAHMDTVGPCEAIHPVVEGDVVRTDGTSVLGGDDKSGIAAILEAVRTLRERRVDHGPIDLLFTVSEEFGLMGAKHFDVSRLRARRGVVLDCDGVGALITRAPAANRFMATVHGLAAHAGICPEQGLSAVKLASVAIAEMRLGRVDAETTANIGLIQGGASTNVVPDRVVVRGEARSRSVEKLEAQTAHMRACFERAVAGQRVRIGEREHAARVEVHVERAYEPLSLDDRVPVVQLFIHAAKRLGQDFRTAATGGGSDANVLTARGLEVANLACGMREIHTVNEWIDVRDMVATAELLVAAIELNAGAS